MNRGCLILGVCLLGIALLPACGDKGNGQPGLAGSPREEPARDPVKDAAERELLKAAIDEHYAACKSGDLDRIFATFSAEMVSGFEQQMARIEEQSPEIAERPRETLANSYKLSYENVEHEILAVDFSLPDYQGEPHSRVIVDVVRKVPEGAESTPSDAPNEDEILFVMVKRDGKWVIASVMSKYQVEAGQRASQQGEH
ncbi:MAG: hypothetical protein V2A76_10670 [Planctomycetota bacterium]